MRAKQGFTFLEILVAMLIISVLSGVVGLSLYQYVRRAKVEAARAQIKTFKTALQMYRTDQGALPTQAQGLESLCVAPTVPPTPRNYPAEGYLDTRVLPPDPWGNPYVYFVPGRENEPYEVISYGSDGEPGGDEDAADLTSSAL